MHTPTLGCFREPRKTSERGNNLLLILAWGELLASQNVCSWKKADNAYQKAASIQLFMENWQKLNVLKPYTCVFVRGFLLMRVISGLIGTQNWSCRLALFRSAAS